jgi:hypothetical protein
MPFIFDKKTEVERKEFREAIRKRLRGGAPPPKLSFQDKMKIEKKIFGPKYIEKISQDDYKKALRKMDRLKFGATTETDRKFIENRVGYLKRIGGIKSLKKPSQIKPSQVKEEKKDISMFEPYTTREKFRQLLRKPETWKVLKKSVKDRLALEKKLFDPKRFGIFIDKREAKIVSKDLESYPIRVKTRYGITDKVARIRTSKLLKKLIGK